MILSNSYLADLKSRAQLSVLVVKLEPHSSVQPDALSTVLEASLISLFFSVYERFIFQILVINTEARKIKAPQKLKILSYSYLQCVDKITGIEQSKFCPRSHRQEGGHSQGFNAFMFTWLSTASVQHCKCANVIESSKKRGINMMNTFKSINFKCKLLHYSISQGKQHHAIQKNCKWILL